jgi:hypothetical protein
MDEPIQDYENWKAEREAFRKQQRNIRRWNTIKEWLSIFFSFTVLFAFARLAFFIYLLVKMFDAFNLIQDSHAKEAIFYLWLIVMLWSGYDKN